MVDYKETIEDCGLVYLLMIFGYNTPLILHHLVNILNINDIQLVSKYLNNPLASFQEHNLFHRMKTLHTHTVYPLTVEMGTEYESIDAFTGNIMDKAELKCRQLHTGKVIWFSAYKRVCLQLVY